MTIRFTNVRPQTPPPGIDPDELELLLHHGERVMAWLREDERNPRRFAEAPRQVLARICPELTPLLRRLPAGSGFHPLHPALPADPGAVRFTTDGGEGGAR